MMKGLKNFGLGILWALLSPILLLGIVLAGVFGLLNFLVQFVIMVINFFKGKKLFPMYKEDEIAYKRIQQAMGITPEENNPNNPPAPVPSQPAPQQVFVQQNYYTQPGVNPAQPGNPYPQPNAPYPQQGAPYPQPGMQNPYVQQPGYPQPMMPQQPYQGPLPNPYDPYNQGQPTVNPSVPPMVQIPQAPTQSNQGDVAIFEEEGDK